MTRPPVYYRGLFGRTLICGDCGKRFRFRHPHLRYRDHVARKH